MRIKMETENKLFITDENELIKNSWNLLLRKSPTLTALEEYKQKQRAKKKQ